MPNKKVTKNNRKSLKKSIKRSKVNSNIKGGGDKTLEPEKCIFESLNITTQPNEDINYKEVGIIHVSDTAGVNFLRSFGSSITTSFGGKGFEAKVFDSARNSALKKLNGLININNEKVCNLRMDVNTGLNSNLFVVHLYGTLLRKGEKS